MTLIKHYESCKLEAYKDSVGVWTIGWGTTKGVKPGMKITQAEADRLLAKDLDEEYEPGVQDAIKVPYSQAQFDACVSFAYNLGVGAFQSSTLLKMLNAGNPKGAADQFKRWTLAGGVSLLGLRRRRAAESLVFQGYEAKEAIKIAQEKTK